MDKVSKYIFLFLNAVAVLLLFGAFIAPMVNPEKMSMLSFFGLIMPYLIILNVFFVFYWLIKAKFYFVISLLAIAISWSSVKTSFPYSRHNEEGDEANLSVLSYNVRIFDRYNWTGDEETPTNILRFIKEQDADVLCLQEFGSSQKGTTERFILNALGRYPYRYIHYTPKSRNKKHRQGLAILSKYPLSNKGLKGDPALRTGCSIFADVRVDGSYVRVVNAHYESISFTGKYDLINALDAENYKTRIKGAVKSFNATSINHALFSDQLRDVISASDHPVVLCADMNNSPVSYSYNVLSKPLNDAYLKFGIGFGATYNGSYPFLRIDYVMYSDELNLIDYQCSRVDYSDHYPILTQFSFR